MSILLASEPETLMVSEHTAVSRFFTRGNKQKGLAERCQLLSTHIFDQEHNILMLKGKFPQK